MLGVVCRRGRKKAVFEGLSMALGRLGLRTHVHDGSSIFQFVHDECYDKRENPSHFKIYS
jgi:hypothetical protein